MEENSAALECMLLFYIGKKHELKTKQLVKNGFLDQMVKHCEENGFNYDQNEIKSAWTNLLSKYIDLKTRGVNDDKERWKYFEILDSCYEQSDFHDTIYPKFSEEMVWFLIGCFLKRKSLKTWTLSSVIEEVYKEFVVNGYLHITRRDIEKKWKFLNLKYDKLKNDPPRLKLFPYLQALHAFRQEKNTSIVNMIFTKELTEILIECFTKKKISCIIQGYESDQVLSEIQWEFMDLGFYFSKDIIKDKWQKLSNIYKFITSKGKRDSQWLYFTAMKKHFENDFLYKLKPENDIKKRCLRPRSKSECLACNKEEFVNSKLVVHLKKLNLPTSAVKSRKEKSVNNKRTFKRSIVSYEKSNSGKKLRTDTETEKSSASNRVKRKKLSKSFSESTEVKKVSFSEKQSEILNTLPSEVGVGKNQENGASCNAQTENCTSLLVSAVCRNENEENQNITSQPEECTMEVSELDKNYEEASEEIQSVGKIDMTNVNVQKSKVKCISDNAQTENDESVYVSETPTSKNVENEHNSPVKKVSMHQIDETHEQFLKNSPCKQITENEFLPFKKRSRNDDNSGNLPEQEVVFVDEERKTENYTTVNCSVNNGHFILPDVSETDSCEDHLKNTEISDSTTIACENNIQTENNVDSIDICNDNNVNTIQEYVVPITLDDCVETNTNINNNSTLNNYMPLEENNADNNHIHIENVQEEFVNKTQSAHCNNKIDNSASVKNSNNIFYQPLPADKVKIGNHSSNESYTTSYTPATVSGKRTFHGFKFLTQVIKPASINSVMKPASISSVIKPALISSVIKPASISSVADKEPNTFVRSGEELSGKVDKNEDFDLESVASEAVGDDGLKENLLATVIDFQEQNNEEFIEIKNLMKQNNLLQRETNRLLRLYLEKY